MHQARMLFKDRLCLWLDDPVLSKVHSVVMDFRGCTTTVFAGPTALVANGPYMIRSLMSLGLQDLIADGRYYGRRQEILTILLETIKIGSVVAITLCPLLPEATLAAAVDAAKDSVNITMRVQAPRILLSPLLSEENEGGKQYLSRLFRCADAAVRAGVAGMVVFPECLEPLREKGVELSLLAVARKPAADYRTRLPQHVAKEPGVSEVLKRGADHALFDSRMCGADREWTVDLLRKEVASCEKKGRKTLSHLLDSARLAGSANGVH